MDRRNRFRPWTWWFGGRDDRGYGLRLWSYRIGSSISLNQPKPCAEVETGVESCCARIIHVDRGALQSPIDGIGRQRWDKLLHESGGAGGVGSGGRGAEEDAEGYRMDSIRCRDIRLLADLRLRESVSSGIEQDGSPAGRREVLYEWWTHGERRGVPEVGSSLRQARPRPRYGPRMCRQRRRGNQMSPRSIRS